MFDNERAYDTLEGWLLAPLLPKEGLGVVGKKFQIAIK